MTEQIQAWLAEAGHPRSFRHMYRLAVEAHEVLEIGPASRTLAFCLVQHLNEVVDKPIAEASYLEQGREMLIELQASLRAETSGAAIPHGSKALTAHIRVFGMGAARIWQFCGTCSRVFV